ncbi:hypothetical protein [Spirosoma utsteinense]|uniref:Uncharacterized protein n=1 Tax=Spirosoma utsteinense TaxID=2585773 RepID=A0ABR6W2L4_9BACT|nr:hypothetical protein [Spirosoma utsteinense]MBC3784998.1 hypothetical protein [Spirosoma utsteinense]MBC3790393.1 hypothetical protein [Spirosoma utsteinense]
MKQLIKKIGSLLEPITAEKGTVLFFALARREDASVWDLLVAAKWIDEDRKSALDYLVNQVQQVLTKQELLYISAVIMLRHEYFIDGSLIKREMGWEESNIDLYGVAVEKAYIFVAPDVEFKMGPLHAIH